jgi:antitoxin VapB
MAINVKNEDADRLARELSALTGESITEAITTALRERLERHRAAGRRTDRLTRLVEELRALPILDDRDPDAIIGYDERGLPA